MGLGKRVVIGDVNYLYFLAPGILFMVVVNNSYMTTSMRLMIARDWDKTLITALSAPIKPVEIVLGYMLAGVTQALAACAIFIVLMNYFLGYRIYNRHVFDRFASFQEKGNHLTTISTS